MHTYTPLMYNCYFYAYDSVLSIYIYKILRWKLTIQWTNTMDGMGIWERGAKEIKEKKNKGWR
jgi:hypothetical protein